MTETQLLNYKMNSNEQARWDNLEKRIKDDFKRVARFPELQMYDLQHLVDDFFEKRGWGAMGYVEGDGFYRVVEGDRGHISVIFSGMDFSAAKDKLVIFVAHDSIYNYVVKNMKSIEDENIGKWRYRRINDGIVKENEFTRMLSHAEEQKGWIYDAEYDYRIYWFEPMLFMIKRLVDESAFVSTVEYYDKCMNHVGTDRKWKYNTEAERYQLNVD